MSVIENVEEVYKEIENTLDKINKKKEEITIVAVTKSASLTEAEEIVRAGILDIGENRIREAENKYNYLSPKFSNIKWHLVGHLQTNKVKKAVKIFDLIHSLDSIKLAEEINKEAVKINKVQNVLVEVKISKEDTKYGIDEKEILEFLKQIEKFDNLIVLGLMAIAPYTDNKEIIEESFEKIKNIFEEAAKVNYKNSKMKYLSCGMTGDYKEALLKGANMLRIGTAFFKK